ncbi:unnamed protein product [Amoebophrya sp. A120]|nr:unnamed protein product [Amoebophrya sp. A120]|eukprot:GSA120T00025604001.1
MPSSPAGGPEAKLRPGESPDAAEERGNEAMTEAFNKLVHAIDGERSKIKQSWTSVNEQYQKTQQFCNELKQETEQWIQGEKAKIEAAWQEIEATRNSLKVLDSSDDTLLKLSCSGVNFQLRKGALAFVPDSHLNALFAAESSLKKDADGRYVLDFNPECFALILDYVKNKALAPDKSTVVPIPPIPAEQRTNMDLLCEALKFTYFLPPNEMVKNHGTSLIVTSNTAESTHDGWQLISAAHPLRNSRRGYFEAKIESNSDPRGGLAIGVTAVQPSGDTIHQLKQKFGVLYNSNNGVIDADCTGTTDVTKQVMFKEGSVIGCEYNPDTFLVRWFFNSQLIGSCSVKAEKTDKFAVVYPVFGLYAKGQKIKIDFQALLPPSASS